MRRNTWMNQTYLALISLLLSSSCTTQRQIEQEEAIKQSQKITASTSNRLEAFDENLKKISGIVEENSYHLAKNRNDQEQSLNQLKEESQSSKIYIEEELKKLSIKLDQQQKFIEQTLAALKKIQVQNIQKKTVSKKRSSYNEGIKFFSKKQYSKAKQFLERSLSEKISGRQKERAQHNLGIIAFSQKKFDESLIYFSKIVTTSPKSAYAPNSLLHIGKILVAKGEIPNAKSSYTKLIEEYPKSRFVPEAKKLLQKL